MGSSVSAAAANLYMEYFKGLAPSQTQADCVSRIWKKYDTFYILKKSAVEELLNHFNNLQPSIQFTVEVKRDGSLPFLDTLLQRKEDGNLGVTVYRKPIHTDRYLDFQSHHLTTSREVWSYACTTEPRTPPTHRTILHKRSTTSPWS